MLESGSYTTAAMPPVEFEYSRPVLSSAVRELDPESRHALPPVIDGRAHQWVDLDGEGIPGLLSEEPGAWRYRRNLGAGLLSTPRVLPQRPSTAKLSGSRQQLMSLEGDGRLELVELGGPMPGFYTRNADEDGWEGFRAFRAIPVGLDWDDPSLQILDLNGDGFADILVLRGTSLLWYPSRGKDGFGAPIEIPVPRNEEKGPAVVYSDHLQSIVVADMGGDGLGDLVRIRNGEVCYWPNLGYARFGAKLTMASSPWFDRRDRFDPSRLRMFDVDGSGTTDILYLGAEGITLYSNLAGNRWSAAHVVTTALPAHSAASISVVDLLGTGTGCLTWFTTLPSEGAPRLRYIDLLDSKKPHLLVKQTNGMGLERLVSYAPSTKFYLEDVLAGVRWATKLPFPVHVVARVEVRDYLAGTRLVSTYRYRHGFYDGHEREFRGFGLVEQWDAETVKSDTGAGSFPSDLFPVVDGEFVLPPVHTKTWFHTGAWKEQEALTEVFRAEYYDGDSLAVDLPETAYSGVALTSTEELREAARALKGMVLRQEVYADDGTTKAPHPYTVSERCYEVRRIQPRTAGAAHAVFLAHPREELTYHYERVSNDPRVLHALSLEVDDFGVVTKAATVAYRRRSPTGPASTEQGAMLVSVAEQQVVHKAGETHWYRIGVPISSTSYELHGLAAPSPGGVLALSTVKAAVADASVIAYDATPTSGYELRVLSKQRTFYYENDLSAPLALGSIESLALLHHQEQLAFSSGLLTTVYGTAVTSTMLTSEGGYVADSGDYWAPSARPIYDAAHFFLPVGLVEPFGNQSSVTYDGYDLLVTEAHSSTTTAALDNVISLENDYRVLQPKLLTDPNDNRTAVAFDALGMVIKTAVMGKVGAGEGDTLADPTTQFSYDLWAFKTSGLPVVAHMQAREQHGGTAVWQHAYVYTDGSGRELLTKAQAAPAEGSSTARWVGTGRTVFDNKGNPIKKYEPYFSATSGYESEAAIVATGVTPILRYDPVGRLVRTDLPDGTFSKVVFDAWKQEAWDQNDCILGSVWYAEHADAGASAQDQRAATLAAAHASTPTTTHYDTLGRAVSVLQHNGFDSASPPAAILFETHSTLDILGNALAVVDARGNTPLAQSYDLLKRPIRVQSAEAGISKVLPDVAGVPVRTWNSRNVATRTTFDALRRPTHAYAKIDTASETLVQRTLYGEELGSTASKAANLRGQLYRTYDSAGVLTHVEHDFKGNLLETQRRLATSYTATPDWSALASLTSVTAIESAAASSLETEVFTTSSTYDALNRVVTSTTPDSSVAEPTYNEASQLTAMDVMVRGATSATSFVTDIFYNARGQRTKISYANGVLTEYTYDSKTFRLTRLVSTRTSDGAVLQDLRYWYDPVGNIVETRDFAQASVYFSNTVVSPDSKYEYDPLYRLTYAEGREHPAHSGSMTSDAEYSTSPDALPHPNDLQVLRRYTESYAYDGVGNILELVHATTGSAPNGWTRWYQYATASNKLTGTSDTGDTEATPYANSTSYTDAYTHDARGNMTSMPHLAAMDWDLADRLQHCNLGGGGHSYFVYDAAGQRVRKIWVKSSSLIEERIYVGGYEVWRKRLSGSVDEEKQTLHVMDDQRRVAMVETKTVDSGSTVSSPTSYLRYQLDDLLGSARVEVDGSGALLTYEEYHPYGTTAFRASAGASGFAPKRYRYTGKERDDETGLYYYGARYYPPWLARWTAVDPAGMVDGPNVYVYVRANPIGLRDPEGTSSTPVMDLPTAAEASERDKADPRITGPRDKFRALATTQPGPDIITERDPDRPTGEIKKEDAGPRYTDITMGQLDDSIRTTYKRLTGIDITKDVFIRIKGKVLAELPRNKDGTIKVEYFNVGNLDAGKSDASVKGMYPDASGNPKEHKFSYYKTLDAGVEGYIRHLQGRAELWSAIHYGTDKEFVAVLQSTGYHELPFGEHRVFDKAQGEWVKHPGAEATVLGGMATAKETISSTIMVAPSSKITGTVSTQSGGKAPVTIPVPGLDITYNPPKAFPWVKSDFSKPLVWKLTF